jgi:hypothetical protein
MSRHVLTDVGGQTITFFWNVSDFLQTKGEGAFDAGLVTSKAESERGLLDIVERTDVDSRPALWMLLLLRLTGVSKDRRAEVRNGEQLAAFDHPLDGLQLTLKTIS